MSKHTFFRMIRADAATTLFYSLSSESMQQQVRQICIQAGVLASAGLSFVALKALKSQPTIAAELAETKYLKHSNIALCIPNIKLLQQPELLREFIKKNEEFLECVDMYNNNQKMKGHQFIAHRMTIMIKKHMIDMAESAKKSRDSRILEAAVILETEDMASIMNECETKLQNMLMGV